MQAAIHIKRAGRADSALLANMGKVTFIASHGISAAAIDIEEYVAARYSLETVQDDLADDRNIYHILYYNGEPAGYSKIVLNTPPLPEWKENATKLERLYLLQPYYHLGLGQTLLQFNIDLSRQQQQQSMWLYVWTGNERAVHFYLRQGFKQVGSHDFKLTERHSNPNYLMVLEY